MGSLNLHRGYSLSRLSENRNRILSEKDASDIDDFTKLLRKNTSKDLIKKVDQYTDEQKNERFSDLKRREESEEEELQDDEIAELAYLLRRIR